jgi:hypothetical protein
MPRFSGKKTDTGVPVTIDKERYTEGDVAVALEGGIALGEKPGNVAYPIQIDASGYLKVAIGGGVTPGTEYSDGDSNAGSKGTLIMGDDGTLLQNIAVDANGRLQVEVVEGEYDGVQYQDGAAVASPFGTVMMGHDGSNVFPVVVDSSGYLQIQVIKASVLNTVADVTLAATSTTQIIGQVMARFCALICNLAGNSQTFRVGDSNTGATRGVELAPGESIMFETTEAIYGYNPGGSGEAVSVVWTED